MMGTRNRQPLWRVILILAGAAGLLLLVKWLSWSPWAPGLFFLGRFHPAILHLPIGLLLASLVLSLLKRIRPLLGVGGANLFLLELAAGTGLLTAASGLLLGAEAGHESDLLETHERLGVLVAISMLATSCLGRVSRSTRSRGWSGAYRFSWVVTLGALLAAGHYGGTLTHGQGYLTELMPGPIATLLGEGSSPERPIRLDPERTPVYKAVVQPLLEDRCSPCHAGDQAKGGLRLDAPEGLQKGGSDGPVISPSKHAESELMRRIYLPLAHKEHMPPSGRPQLNPAEAELIRWWIDSGADFEATVAEMSLDGAPGWALGDLSDRLYEPAFLALEVSAADPEAVQAARLGGFSVSPVFSGSPFLQVSAGFPRESVGDRDLAQLKPIAGQTVWLDLSGTAVTDAGVQTLSAFAYLARLHLEKTSIGDGSLDHLADLQYLEYLNLYGTGITDEGVGRLARLQRLRTLCIWQTAVTDAGLDLLLEANSSLEIIRGE